MTWVESDCWIAIDNRIGFRTSAICLAAKSFTMPALSPTMTEGNISKWSVKEGDSFVAGDLLLEIETDKASMDVEAQEDGIMAKIIKGDGTKGIKVGARIGVLAEVGDDLSTLEIPPEESAPAPPAPKEEAPKPEAPKARAATPPSDAPAKTSSKPAKKQTYPLLPSVEHLLHQYGLDSSAIENMTPTGPNNRLLKGDVLAYLGSVSSSYPKDLSSKIAKFSRLDLSNIKVAPPPAASKPAPPPPPPPKMDKRTSDALFYQVLGIKTKARTPAAAIPSETIISEPPAPKVPARKPDIIELLTGKAKSPSKVLLRN